MTLKVDSRVSLLGDWGGRECQKTNVKDFSTMRQYPKKPSRVDLQSGKENEIGFFTGSLTMSFVIFSAYLNYFDLNNNVAEVFIEMLFIPKQYTDFDILKFSLAVRPRGHKQRHLNGHVYSFLLFVSFSPHY